MFRKILRWFFNLLQLLGEKIQNKEIKDVTLQSVPFWIASVITGVLAIAYSTLFNWGEHFLASLPLRFNWLLFLYVPSLMLFSWWLVKRFAPTASGSGIPQLMASIEMAASKNQGRWIDSLLNIKVILVKFVSSFALLMSGGAVGREGPTIQISGAVFNVVNNWLPSYWPRISRRLMLISGGAAGLAAAFNTPLGGIVFAIEELGKTHLRTMRTQLFISVIIAGLTSQLFLGSYLYLKAPSVQTMEGFAILYVVIAAFLAGLAGYYFSFAVRKIGGWRTKIKRTSRQVIFVSGLGLLLAGVIFYTGNNAVGSGKSVVISILFGDAPLPWYTFFSRFAGTTLAYLSGGAGGVFAPALALGATLGDAIVQLLQIENFKNLVVITSMIGFMCGVTHSPFTSFILVLEMTNGQHSVFPMMLAAIVSFGAAKSMDSRSLYEHLSERYLKIYSDNRLRPR